MGDLEAEVPESSPRIGVMNHLGVLEQGGLVRCPKQGRHKNHSDRTGWDRKRPYLPAEIMRAALLARAKCEAKTE